MSSTEFPDDQQHAALRTFFHTNEKHRVFEKRKLQGTQCLALSSRLRHPLCFVDKRHK